MVGRKVFILSQLMFWSVDWLLHANHGYHRVEMWWWEKKGNKWQSMMTPLKQPTTCMKHHETTLFIYIYYIQENLGTNHVMQGTPFCCMQDCRPMSKTTVWHDRKAMNRTVLVHFYAVKILIGGCFHLVGFCYWASLQYWQVKQFATFYTNLCFANVKPRMRPDADEST